MLDFRFYFALFLRRLPYFLVFTVAGSAVGLGLALTLPPKYEAQARLVVESEQIPGDLAESTVQTEAIEQLQIIEQRIKTRETLLDMAERLDIYKRRSGQENAPLRPDQIVDDLRERIVITTTGGAQRRNQPVNATFVDVSFSAASANLAARVTNEVVTLMLEENRSMRTGVSGDTLDFFEQEVQRLDAELTQRGAAIIRFQEANREALPDSLIFRRGQLEAAQERLLQLNREEAELTDRREGLVALYEQNGSLLPVDAGNGNRLSPEERQLQRLKEQLATSAAVLSLDNPRIRVMKSQIEALEELIAEQTAAAVLNGEGAAAQTDSQPLTLYDVQLADLDNQLEFISDSRAQIEADMARLQETIDATPANAIELDTLQRNYDAARAQYDQAVAKRAQAETGDIIEARNKGTRISTIEQAVAPAEPTSPNRPRLAMAGTAAGILVATAFVVLLELLNTSIRRPQDIVRQLDIMPFGTLPYIRTRRDILRRRLILLFVLVGVGGAVFGALWGLNTYVMPLDLLFERILDQVPKLDLSFPSQDP